ncbi:MAG TPA: hypothetical protein PLL14_02690 [Accumulibacter sp.]|nr:hypothetical protein [Accumulibacter sp.]
MQQTDGVPWFLFGVATLAVWRLTHLLHAEDGPFELCVRLRHLLGEGFFGKLLDCFYCLSMWTAAPAAWLVGGDWREWMLLWLALSATAILVERVHAGLLAREQACSLPAIYSEDAAIPEEETDELLRK